MARGAYRSGCLCFILLAWVIVLTGDVVEYSGHATSTVFATPYRGTAGSKPGRLVGQPLTLSSTLETVKEG